MDTKQMRDDMHRLLFDVAGINLNCGTEEGSVLLAAGKAANMVEVAKHLLEQMDAGKIILQSKDPANETDDVVLVGDLGGGDLHPLILALKRLGCDNGDSVFANIVLRDGRYLEDTEVCLEGDYTISIDRKSYTLADITGFMVC